MNIFAVAAMIFISAFVSGFIVWLFSRRFIADSFSKGVASIISDKAVFEERLTAQKIHYQDTYR